MSDQKNVGAVQQTYAALGRSDIPLRRDIITLAHLTIEFALLVVPLG